MDHRENSGLTYETSQQLMDQLRYAAEALSLEFDQWGVEHISGPGLYFVVVADAAFHEYTDPLRGNHWPTECCSVVGESMDDFVDAAREVAYGSDGAVLVAADGTIQQQMVRIRSSPGKETADFTHLDAPDWMGTKHLSALEVSTHEEVLWAVTLSEENGRVSSFLDGTFEDYPRNDIGGRWRPD